MDQDGYVYGTLPAAGKADAPVIGLIAHMDTCEAACGEGVNPHIVKNYDGGDILLNPEKNIVMRAADYENLAENIGNDLVVTDGTTLLGADDKAGIAEILTAVEKLRDMPNHGTVKIAFTPDEEIGRGADRFDVPGFGAKYAFTVDGGRLGDINYETFNGAFAQVVIHGLSIHPGASKNKMKNAQLVAMEFNAMLPPHEIPACTEGYEGFHHLLAMSGAEERAELQYYIRDHDRARFEEKKSRFEKVAAYLNDLYGAGTVDLTMTDTYYNMKEKIEPCMYLIDRAQKAMRLAGVESHIVPVRGGTDGSRLSYMGLPCPNLSTAGYNAHGRFEYVAVQSMDKMVDVIVNVVMLTAAEPEK
jgi:tripeptide aminopeptidase